ncbi:type I secretion membrane fusion protein, HlyD family [Sulfuricurvum kujiense DSM 16994]|uniref:Type I secretion membrane fusion protein, HlyD family n=1 Tax=Sulfuricurvum kujiense (strain ATCC BAA-921 / DSM 16994 / JCM 11577 / YK-1) TaxID=709032 RepID=E4TX21_SULKY|nr:HlyD family type I secretion periplasmic adaptor subunit [Sulfuricurvum kujiense]ADR33862.1 type I secretion membrane fusion protein, HlyD family [Sulfuricurvum kujiense DSM 16994]
MGLFHTKDKHEFTPLLVEIEERPTSPLGRSLLWSLFAFLTISLLWLFLAKIDVVVSARGKVVPDGEIKTLQPVETGVIGSILVKEGQSVKKGEVLMEIDPSVTQSDLASKQKNLTLLELEIERLDAQINDRAFHPSRKCQESTAIATQQMMYTSGKLAYDQQRQVLQEQIRQNDEATEAAKADKSRLKQLLTSAKEHEARLKEVLDIIAKKEYIDAQNQRIEYQEQLTMKEHAIAQSQGKLNELNQQLRLVTQEYRNKLLADLTQKSKEATSLRTEVETTQFRNAKQQIIAPVDGTIGKLLVHTVGGVVTPAEKLLTVIPKGVPLIIKATVLNQDIGFVTKEMEAAVKIDTFDFQKYGLIHGEVKHIADDAIDDEKLGPVYEIAIAPSSLTLKGEGKTLSIHPGMSVTAELKVGKRRVIEFFIYPMIKYLDEGLSVR